MDTSIAVDSTSAKTKEGTVHYHFQQTKSLALDSVKDKILQEKIKELTRGSEIRVKINRNKASVFATEGKIDHDGTQTIFG